MPAIGRIVLVGFDSAWTDNPRNPGGICALVLENNAPPVFHPPRLARFDEAERFVAGLCQEADLLLVAIDQPTLVPNRNGSRPVDRIAASLIGHLQGGVQPACRDGFGARMFGDDAPIWRFLRCLSLVQDPQGARVATTGRYAMEVFPALALPAFQASLLDRRRGAKYNPAVRRHFLLADWQLACAALSDTAASLGLSQLAEWGRAQAGLLAPRKADQDRLDAALCLLIAAHWRLGDPDRSLVIGDLETGYVVTPVSARTAAILENAARKVASSRLASPATPEAPQDRSWQGRRSARRQGLTG